MTTRPFPLGPKDWTVGTVTLALYLGGVNDSKTTASAPGAIVAVGSYVRRLAATTHGLFRVGHVRRLLRAAVAQMAIDVVIYELLLTGGCNPRDSHLISFVGGFLPPLALVGFVLSGRAPTYSRWKSCSGMTLVGLAALFLRGGVLALALKTDPGMEWTAVFPTALAAALITFGGTAYLVASSTGDLPPRTRRRLLAIGAILYLLVLRLAYIGATEVMPEEAYYWNYAQHLDWSYLDHPPMVAWIIGLGSALFGASAFGVRIGAWTCWLLTAGFACALTRELFDRRAALAIVLLIAALPFFFGIGLVMTPDAPVTAAWAATLYFLVRALLREEKAAWIGVGLSLGLGLLSKYTIALSIPATALCMLLDSQSRRWWRRPQPYLALTLAGVLFLPVIWWNSQHEWVSFLFQTAGRLNETAHFSLHELIGAALFLLTPTGLVAAIIVLWSPGQTAEISARPSGCEVRRHHFMVCFTLVPLAVFTVFSLTHHTKLNWTGPTWLAVLPAVAAMLTVGDGTGSRRWRLLVRRMWTPTCVILVLLYGALLHYLALGHPGIRYPAFIADVAGWRDLESQITTVADRSRASTGTRPLVVGMDRYNIASELAFYGYPEGPRQAAGRHLFDQTALMYRYWFPEREQDGKTMILVARREGQLVGDNVVQCFDSLGPITAAPVTWNGMFLRRYYYRIGFGYHAQDAREPAP